MSSLYQRGSMEDQQLARTTQTLVCNTVSYDFINI